MATTPHDPALAPLTEPAGAALLPLLDESPQDYLERLRAIHARSGALIEAIEAHRPALGSPRPEHARRDVLERRDPFGEDRRAGGVGRVPERAPAASPPWARIDVSVAMWALQVAAWIAIVVLVLVYGV